MQLTNSEHLKELCFQAEIKCDAGKLSNTAKKLYEAMRRTFLSLFFFTLILYVGTK